MSISSMTNVAVNHSVAKSTRVPLAQIRSFSALSRSAQGSAGQTSAVNEALDVVMAYIPTEILTVYVPILALLESAAHKEASFQGFLIATPIVVWLLFAAKLKTASGNLPLNPKTWPWWEMIAATLAFLVWACALDLEAIPWEVNAKVASILVIISAPLLGLLAPIFRASFKVASPLDASDSET